MAGAPRSIQPWEIDAAHLPKLYKQPKGFERKALAAIIAAHRGGFEGVLILVDGDGDADRRVKALNAGVQRAIDEGKGLPERCVVGVAIRMTEAWLIADHDAVCRVIPNWENVADPEAVRNPKRLLELSFEPTEERPTILSFYDALATEASLEAIERRCPAFRRLQDELAGLSRQLKWEPQ